MRITLIQDEIIWGSKSANLQRTEEHLIKLCGKTDLVVLPEMFTTGFCTDRLDLAETMEGGTVRCLKKWAFKYQLAIAGSFIATENGKYYNRAFFAHPTGEIYTADKRHLFSMGGEDKLFSAGDKKLIINYKNFNICILVCYDLRFPVWSRNVNNEYDLLIYVANWPQSRIAVWNTLLTARAIENQSYVCGVNIVGTDGNSITYSGYSRLLDAKGKDTFTLLPSLKQIETITLSKADLDTFREKFPVWKDSDTFRIE